MSASTLDQQPPRGAQRAPSSVSYTLPSERPFWMFLAGSAVTFALATVGYSVVFRAEPPPKVMEVELADIAAVPGEPPPKSEAPPEPTPPPEPEATPEPPPEPPPEEKPEFVKPEPTPPPPKPRVIAPRPPPPAPHPPAPVNKVAPLPVRGLTIGAPAARGGGRGDFIATPKPQYDITALQRHYQGSGDVLITYQNGSIVSVEMTRSTGVAYLDSKTTSHVKSNYRVKPGASGKGSFSIKWELPR